jgi:uncharacterized membrane protein YphA (DoxX/SURF4 family)
MNPKLNSAWWALRIGLGLAALLAGLDKFFNILTDWGQYLSPLVKDLIPVSSDVFMRLVGVIEMAVGALILAGFARIGGYIVMVWLVGIAVSLLTTGRFFDVAVRDVEMALAAFTLARLTEAREAVGAITKDRPVRWGWRLWTEREPLMELDLAPQKRKQ